MSLPESSTSTNIISLGVGCGINVYIQDLGLRTQAYPFDSLWVKNLTNLYEIISTDFSTLLNRNFHKKINYSFPDRIHHTSFDDMSNDFHATFAHHNILDNDIYETFVRRVNRFRELKTENNIFITLCTHTHTHFDPSSQTPLNHLIEAEGTNLQTKIQTFIKICSKMSSYAKSKFICIIAQMDKTSEHKLIYSGENISIYLFSHIHGYHWSRFSDTDHLSFLKLLNELKLCNNK